MGVVPSHKYPPLFSDPDDDDTNSGPPDLREQVTLLNREISQQEEAHAQSLAAVEAVCAEKVWTLESTVQTQSREVSDLRRAYSDMYSFLTRMRSGAFGSGSMPDMPPPLPPPPPPPPAPSQTPPSRPDQTTRSPTMMMTLTIFDFFIRRKMRTCSQSTNEGLLFKIVQQGQARGNTRTGAKCKVAQPRPCYCPNIAVSVLQVGRATHNHYLVAELAGSSWKICSSLIDNAWFSWRQ
ncbi:hypothetical protein PIB30_067539 [Stylosanthes scabra]|uniref:Uncharacterized protein n=1 Tax=Stylosanthes scabra TaxID=79078 RepID=A0ABU6RMK3_9FABA|nr:hypothetical protein [Stylosanthes scabra]